MMIDPIDRQMALDALDELCDANCVYSKKQRAEMCRACLLGSAFDVIEALPTVEQDWIPCSAKYPKENGYYLVTIRGYIDDRLEVAVEYYSPYYSKYLKKWKAINVIAWTLPKPYKGETDG